jgi:hypothetical protein
MASMQVRGERYVYEDVELPAPSRPVSSPPPKKAKKVSYTLAWLPLLTTNPPTLTYLMCVGIVSLLQPAAKKPAALRKESVIEQTLRQHKEEVQKSRAEGEVKRRRFMRRHIDALAPFLDDDLVREIRAMPQPPEVRGGTTRGPWAFVDDKSLEGWGVRFASGAVMGWLTGV